MFTTSDGAGNMDSELLSWLYRVAVKIRADIRDIPQQHCIDEIDIAHAEKVIPESLYLLLHLLGSSDQDNVSNNDSDQQLKTLSIAQNIVYFSSKGRVTTPKHLGIGVIVHQATHSKDLVQLLHRLLQETLLVMKQSLELTQQ